MSISPASPTPPRRWTVLVYSAADNDLNKYLIGDVDEMERVGSDTTTDLVVQLDRGGKEGASRLHLQQDPRRGIRSPVVERLGDTNMSDPATLRDFVAWGVKNYPAERYMLVMSDHGDSWKGAIEDDGHDDWMSLEEIRSGLSQARELTGVKLDVLGFDACNMASAEVAWQLRDEATYMIGSEKTEAAEGWPYNPWLRSETVGILRSGSLSKLVGSPRDVVRAVVRAASKAQEDIETLSALDLGRMQGLGEAIRGLAQAITATSTPAEVLHKIAMQTQSFEAYEDLYDLCERMVRSRHVKDDELKQAAAQVMASVKEVVIEEQHHSSLPGAHGLTLDVPKWREMDPAYGELALSKFTGWPSAQQVIISGKPADLEEPPEGELLRA